MVMSGKHFTDISVSVTTFNNPQAPLTSRLMPCPEFSVDLFPVIFISANFTCGFMEVALILPIVSFFFQYCYSYSILVF